MPEAQAKAEQRILHRVGGRIFYASLVWVGVPGRAFLSPQERLLSWPINAIVSLGGYLRFSVAFGGSKGILKGAMCADSGRA